MTLPEGARLGAYEILAPLGAGGMGEVYRARDKRLGRDVAVKVLSESLALDTVARARFDREARAIAALSHPNILDIHDIGSENGVSFVVTEFLEGETLGERLGHGASRGPLPWRKAVEIGLSVADGLGAAHARGVVHRDLKPANIFLTSDGRVKILDFGIATLETGGPGGDNEQVTETGALIGTAGYISPEQIRRRPADARSDIFAFGCVLYEMATGHRPFTGETAPEVLVATLRGEPRDPADLAIALPEDLRLLVLRCLEKNPARRFQTAQDLSFALKLTAAAPAAPAAARSEPVASTLGMPAPPSRSGRRVALVGASLIAAVAVAVLVRLLLAPSRGRIESLAVLPFVNDTGNPDDEYLSEGITESLINRMSRLPGLRVMARTTVFNCGEKDPGKAGRKLEVQAVLSGRVQRRGNTIVVQADLVDVRRGAQTWGEQFTESASSAFSLPGEIAERISGSLNLEPRGGNQAAGLAHDAEAYDLTLRGRYHLNKRTPEGIEKSLTLFDEALKHDFKEALAWEGLAEAYDLMAFYDFRPPKEILPKQREAAEKAIALDPTLSSARAALADALYQFEWDWKGAEEGFRKALELNPNDAEAHQWYSNLLSASGRFDESLNEIRIARRLDPLNITINMDVGLAMYFAGDDDGAIKELGRTIDLDRTFVLTHIYLGLPELRAGRFTRAVDEFAEAMRLEPEEPDPVAGWGHACARAGRRAEAEEALKRLEAMSGRRFVSAFAFAFLEVGLGHREKALDWLEKAVEERAGRLVFLRVLHVFAPLRDEHRYREIVRRVQIPPVS